MNKQDLETMRHMIAQHETLRTEDADIYWICREGCIGWDNISDKEVIKHFKHIFPTHELSIRKDTSCN